MPSLRILLAEDHRALADNLIEFLTLGGHEVDHAVDGKTAQSLARSGSYDVLILDWGLPRMNGVELCRSIRQEQPEVPILMLTSRESIEEKAEAFEAGVDDFVVKPCELPEIELRCGALARRAARSGTESPADPETSTIDDLRFDRGTQAIYRGERRVELHRIGRELLALLMERTPNVVTREEIEEAIWGGAPPGSEVIRTHVYALRRALEAGGEPRLIHTVRGSGYRLAVEES